LWSGISPEPGDLAADDSHALHSGNHCREVLQKFLQPFVCASTKDTVLTRVLFFQLFCDVAHIGHNPQEESRNV